MWDLRFSFAALVSAFFFTNSFVAERNASLRCFLGEAGTFGDTAGIGWKSVGTSDRFGDGALKQVNILKNLKSVSSEKIKQKK